MLKTVAYAWAQEAVAENAREVHSLGRELYDRLGTMGSALDRLGRSLASAVGHYNKTVGSLESRVLVSARRMRDLEVVDGELESPQPVSDVPRPLVAPELMGDESVVPRIEGAAGREQFSRRASGE
jgi:DNA recombination protein RmuC